MRYTGSYSINQLLDLLRGELPRQLQYVLQQVHGPQALPRTLAEHHEHRTSYTYCMHAGLSPNLQMQEITRPALLCLGRLLFMERVAPYTGCMQASLQILRAWRSHGQPMLCLGQLLLKGFELVAWMLLVLTTCMQASLQSSTSRRPIASSHSRVHTTEHGSSFEGLQV